MRASFGATFPGQLSGAKRSGRGTRNSWLIARGSRLAARGSPARGSSARQDVLLSADLADQPLQLEHGQGGADLGRGQPGGQPKIVDVLGIGREAIEQGGFGRRDR